MPSIYPYREKRSCSFCGKIVPCACLYSDFGLVKLDNSGRTYLEFDACQDCLEKVLNKVREDIKIRPIPDDLH